MQLLMSPRLVNRSILQQGLRLSLPSAIQSSIQSCGNLLLQNFLNGFGTQVIAATTCAYRIDTLILLPILNLGSSISAVVAQNKGAENPKRIAQALQVGILSEIVVALILSFLVVPFGGAMVSIFGLSRDAAALGGVYFQTIGFFM